MTTLLTLYLGLLTIFFEVPATAGHHPQRTELEPPPPVWSPPSDRAREWTNQPACRIIRCNL